MSRNPEIDKKKPAVVVSVRLASDVIALLDLMTDNRSRFMRDATREKINKEMEK